MSITSWFTSTIGIALFKTLPTFILSCKSVMSSVNFSLLFIKPARVFLPLINLSKSTSASSSVMACNLFLDLSSSYSALSLFLLASSSSAFINLTIAVESDTQKIFFSNSLNSSELLLSKGKGSSNSLSIFIRFLSSSRTNPLLSTKSVKLEFPVFLYSSPLTIYLGDFSRDHSMLLPA